MYGVSAASFFGKSVSESDSQGCLRTKLTKIGTHSFGKRPIHFQS
jgi:hypothetical protein